MVDNAIQQLEPKPSAPRIARYVLANMLDGVGCSDATHHTAALLVSELVTNAVRHAGTSPLTLDITVDAGRVHVAVADCDPNLPAPLLVGPEAESGRGLSLVDHLAESWGADPLDGGRSGKVVWFELPCS